jgi:hypothetical protein
VPSGKFEEIDGVGAPEFDHEHLIRSPASAVLVPPERAFNSSLSMRMQFAPYVAAAVCFAESRHAGGLREACLPERNRSFRAHAGSGPPGIVRAASPTRGTDESAARLCFEPCAPVLGRARTPARGGGQACSGWSRAMPRRAAPISPARRSAAAWEELFGVRWPVIAAMKSVPAFSGYFSDFHHGIRE